MYLQISPILGCWGVRLGLAGVVVGGAIALGSNTLAQVVPDNTLGGENSVVTSTDSVDTISGGATRGGNLFHSLDQFSIPTGREVFFNNAANIQNILTRVTGGSISNIDGLIGANGAANLFLLNPNGIVFGQNARLNIGGSFIATTANSINFADGTQFSATPDTGAPLLTVSVPSGLQFGTNPGNIINRASGVGLQVQPGRTLGLIGGNVSLDGGNLTARGGRIELGAAAAPGVVGINSDSSGFRFSFPTDLALGDISLTNSALVDVRAEGGGSIAINARNLDLREGSQLASGIRINQGVAGSVAGDIDINAQSTITIDGVDQQGFSSGIFNNVNLDSKGKGGNINITTGSLFLKDGGAIVTSTDGLGDAGNVNINARDTISFDGIGRNGFYSGIYSNVRSEGIGNGGSVSITTSSLSLTGGSFITANTFGRGNAGNVNINASDTISFDGVAGNGFSAGIFSNVREGARGNGGDINLVAGGLSLTNGAQLSANTFGQGDAGNISVQANRSIFLSNSNIFSNVDAGGIGNGGNVNIKADSLSLTDGSQILAALRGASNNFSGGRGNGGNVNIDVRNSFSASGSNNIGNPSGVFTFLGSGATGKGGDIEIKARSLSLTDGAQIITSVFGVGNAGNINIEASDTISIIGINNEGFPGVILSSVEGGGRGNGGSINVKAQTLFLANNGRLISSSFGQGNAGNIDVNVRTLELDNGGIFAESASGGGNIRLRTSKELRLRNSSQISTLSGSGGNITIESPLIIASYNGNNDIITNALVDRGSGDIRITAESIFGLQIPDRSELQKLLGTNSPTETELISLLSRLPSNDIASLSGNLNINAAEVFLNPNLAELPTTPVDASTLVASGCPSGAENRFVVAGRGGLPPAPGDKLSADALLTNWATLTTPETDNRAAAEQTIPEAANTTATPLVEATTWQFGSKGEIILTNADPAAPNQFDATPSNCPSS